MTKTEISDIVLFVVRNNKCASGSAVEHHLAKVGVAGSIPVSRSFKRDAGFCIPFSYTKILQGAVFNDCLVDGDFRVFDRTLIS